MKTGFALFTVALLAINTARAQPACAFVFHAKDAKIAAAGLIKFEAGPEFRNIGGWNNTNASVNWSVAELPKGTYRVFAVFACHPNNTGSDFQVAVGNQRANFRVTSTGDWTNFKEADLGPIIIRKTGPAEITARVTRIANRWGINLRTIRLVPEN